MIEEGARGEGYRNDGIESISRWMSFTLFFRKMALHCAILYHIIMRKYGDFAMKLMPLAVLQQVQNNKARQFNPNYITLDCYCALQSYSAITKRCLACEMTWVTKLANTEEG